MWGVPTITYEALPELVFTLDREKMRLTTEEDYGILINRGRHGLRGQAFPDPVVQKQMNDAAPAAPANPDINSFYPYEEWYGSAELSVLLPEYNKEYQVMETTRAYYNVLINGEIYTFTPAKHNGLKKDMTDVPYGLEGVDGFRTYGNSHTVGIFESYDIKTIGVQAYYEEGGVKYYSDLVTLDTETNEITITEVETDDPEEPVIYDLYVVGSMTNDAINKNYLFSYNDGVYTMTKVSMEGEFKITTVGENGTPDWEAVNFGGGFDLENGTYSLLWDGEALNIAMTSVTLTVTYDSKNQICTLTVEGSPIEQENEQNPELSTEGTVEQLDEITITWPDFAAVEIAALDAQLVPQAAETRATAITLTAEVVADADVPTVVLTPAQEVTEGSYQLVVKAGSFTLTDAEGNKVASTEITASYDVVSGVDTLENDNEQVIWFNLQGIRIDNPTDGLYIRVANGKSQKVVITK